MNGRRLCTDAAARRRCRPDGVASKCLLVLPLSLAVDHLLLQTRKGSSDGLHFGQHGAILERFVELGARLAFCPVDAVRDVAVEWS